MSLSRIRAALPVTLVTLGALLLSACGDGGASGGGGQTNYIAGDGGISTVPKQDRRLPNELKGETLDGKQLDIAHLKGKVVVMNVWGSWCPPCRAEAPAFAKVAKETKAEGVEFVGINTRDAKREPAIAFEKNYSVEYPSLYDPIGKLLVNGFPKGSLNPQTIPSTIVLDRDGKVAARALKALSEEDLRDMIDPLIREK
ncbi:TlpA disulfide reductase family protein [Streptomyces sp. NPDC051907]|uniref:TlpA family protein disulfide reductase n=1 Tax=Streptomyces sp. NPDC051907 TaxID=3155284 RepID=UPI003430DC05